MNKEVLKELNLTKEQQELISKIDLTVQNVHTGTEHTYNLIHTFAPRDPNKIIHLIKCTKERVLQYIDNLKQWDLK